MTAEYHPLKNRLQLFHHNKAKVILNFTLFTKGMDLKTIIPSRCKNIDTTGFHCGNRLIRKIAVVRIACFTFFTRTASKRNDFVVIVQKQLSCHLYGQRRHNTHFMAAEQNPISITIYHFLRFFPCGAIGRTAMTFAICIKPYWRR